MEKNKIFEDLLVESLDKEHIDLAQFILEVVGMYYKLNPNYYSKKTRYRPIVEARQMAMFMIRKHTTLTLKKIASIFEKDHATVLHGVKKIKGYKFYDKKTRKEIVDLEYIIKYRSEALKKNENWRNEYYFVDLNNISILNFDEHKSIILTGYSPDEIETVSKSFVGLMNIVKLENTGMYVLKKIKKEEND